MSKPAPSADTTPPAIAVAPAGAGTVGMSDRPAVVTVDDEPVTLPVEVRSAKMVAATWLVDATAAQRVIAYSGLRVSEALPRRAVCSLSGICYLDNDLGPYHELAIAFGVLPHDAPIGTRRPPRGAPLATFIHRLPVNQAFTCRAGREIWGFPKWVTRIDYHDKGHSTEVRLLDEGALALALTVRHGHLPLPEREVAMAAYSWNDGVLRRTPWTTRSAGMRARMGGGASLVLAPGQPIAEELRAVGLPRRAMLTTVTTRMQATFGAPEIVDSVN